jgi:protein-disulfide isomerase
MKRAIPFVIIVIVLLAGLAAALIFMRSTSRPSGPPANTTSGNEAPGAEPPHIRGNPAAPVTLEEFGDFECPTCGQYYTELKKIEGEFGDRLRVVFREYPLYPKPHKYALIAAQAAEAAGLQGRFWEMHDKLYENQKAWSEATDVMPMFVDYAKQIGIDTDRFSRELSGEAVAARIFQDGRRAHALGVSVTPTLFINNKEAKGDSWKPDGVRVMINQALNDTSK